jgi:glycosyltransferase involved in cell wall biosynthesis
LINSPSAPTDLISVVVPTYNSEIFISTTLARIIRSMEALEKSFEIIIVNDGSSDRTWPVVCQYAESDARISAINLLKNYGQHSALMCGLRHTRGKYVVTLDDDLQNPPEEIPRLLDHCFQGHHDLVIGEFVSPKKSRLRMLGTGTINRLVTRVFYKSHDLKLSTFRVIRRDVVDRVCQSNNPTPYITGELIFAAGSISNLEVRHDVRIAGKSTYNPFKIIELIRRIMFSYSIELLRFSCRLGAIAAAIAFIFSVVMIFRGLVLNGVVPGWTSIVATTSFFSGVIILLLSMVGEYLSVVLLQIRGTPAYREIAVVKDCKLAPSEF